MHTALAILLKSKKPLPVPVIAQAIAKIVMRAKTLLITFRMTPFFMQSRSFIKFRFVAQILHSNYTIKLVNSSTATLEYMRKVRTVFCPDFLTQYKSIPLWRSTAFGWTARMMKLSKSVFLSPPARWTMKRCWHGCGCTVSDPVLTQNPKKAGRSGRKQWKIRRANGGK